MFIYVNVADNYFYFFGIVQIISIKLKLTYFCTIHNNILNDN